MATAMLLVALAFPAVAALVVAFVGWGRVSAVATVTAALAVAVAGGVLAGRGDQPVAFALGRLLRADALTAVMLLVIGAVATLAGWASAGYLAHELHAGETTARRARLYGVLINAFVASMVLAVTANNVGVIWVAVEATTVSTAFLVGHRRTSTSLEATWKYVVICSFGITIAFLGTVVLYFASLHAGSGAHALDLDALATRAPALDPGVTRLAGGLLLLGFGTKVGLAPFHTWLADAHSQAPAPVSALMSGVLLSVAMSALLRIKSIVDAAVGATFLRAGLVTMGLLTLFIAASLLVGQRDYKRMLAYSSLEHMGFVAVAAAAGSPLAVAAVLLHVLGHGLAKSVLFICSGHLQHAHGTTELAGVRAVYARNPVLGFSFAAGMIALLGLPPFALFASEIGAARGLAAARLGWVVVVAFVLVLVAFSALARHTSGLLLGAVPDDAPALVTTRTAAVPLMVGVVACLALGVSAGGLGDTLTRAAAVLTGGG